MIFRGILKSELFLKIWPLPARNYIFEPKIQFWTYDSKAVGMAAPWPYSFKIDFVRNPISWSAAWFFVIILKFIFTAIFQIKIHEKKILDIKKKSRSKIFSVLICLVIKISLNWLNSKTFSIIDFYNLCSKCGSTFVSWRCYGIYILLKIKRHDKFR